MTACAAVPTRADQVVTPYASYPVVTVTGYTDGTLLLRKPDGAVTSVPLTAVLRLVVDTIRGMADFNEAEKYFEEERFQQAAARYERSLRVAEGYWRLIIHYRLAQTYDAAGKLERAVDHFIKVAQDSPRAAARVIPASMPARRDAGTRRTVQRFSREADASESAEYGVLMKLLAYELARRSGGDAKAPTARNIADTDIPEAIAMDTVYAIKISAMQVVLSEGAYASLLASLDAALTDCPPQFMPELLILKGRTLVEQPTGQDDLLRAGIAFMRVPIHFPEDARAPEGLFWAARVHERLDRPAKAVQLIEECLEHNLVTDPVRDQAKRELEHLQAILAG